MKQEDGSREPSQYIWAETHRSKRIYHSGQTERRMQWLQQHGYVRRDEHGTVFYPLISMALLGGVDPQRV